MRKEKEKMKPDGVVSQDTDPEARSRRKLWLLLLPLLILVIGIATALLFTTRERIVEIDGFYCLDSGSGYTIVGLTGNQNNQTLVIPETLGDRKVERIADSAFKESGMKSFIVPSGIANMGKNAFDGKGVFSIYMVGRKDLSGMQLDESWSGVGEVIFQDVRPQINVSPAVKDVTEFTGDGASNSGKDMTLDSSNKLPDYEDPGEQLPEFNGDSSFGFGASGEGGADGSGGKDSSGGKDGGSAQAVFERIEIAAPPTKTAYIQLQMFNPAGMAVKAIYSDGFSQLVTGYSYPKDTLKLSDTSVQISYTDKGVTSAARVPVSVVKRTPVKLMITTPPKKTAYVEGTSFEKDGMVVKVGYNNAETKTVTPQYSSNTLFLNQPGIELSYTEDNKQVTVIQPVTVEQKAPTKLRVKAPPLKLSYIEKQSFDKTGVVLEVTYNDGEVKETTDYTIDKTVLEHTDTEVTFTHRFNGKTASASQSVTVVKRLPTSVTVTSPPDKVDYIEEEVFDPSGLSVTVKYDNGVEETLLPDYSKEELVFGQTEVVLTYSENGGTVTIPQPITVRKRLPVKLEVTTPPDKTAYIEEELFIASGMTVTATYDNDKSYIVAPTFPDAELVFGQTEVVLTYSENGGTVTVSQPVAVRKRLPVKLEVTTPPDKTDYIEEEIFNLSGMIVTASYDNGKSYVVTPTVTDPVIVLGQTTVTLTYSENGETVTTTQAIVSRKRLPASLIITSPPDKTSYVEDESFNPVGIAFVVRYDNAKEAVVIPAYENIPLVYGQTEVIFSYTESGVTVTAAQPISVRRKMPSGLIVTKQPNVTAYTAGLKFKPGGMVVEVDYSGKRVQTTGYTFPNVRLTQGQGYVRLSYTEQGKTVTADVPVSVGAQMAVYGKHTVTKTTCSTCKGSGTIMTSIRCERCEGSGRIEVYVCDTCGSQYCIDKSHGGSHGESRECGHCGGSGSKTVYNTCYTCNGSRQQESQGSLIANVEAENGSLPSNGKHSDGYWYVFVRLIQD